MQRMHKEKQRKHRHHRVRSRIHGTAKRPRLVVFRSLKHISAQLIDDDAGKTLAAAGDYQAKKKISGIEQAAMVGTHIAERAVKAGITAVVFDRGGYRYHGRIAALADAARKAGLQF